MTAPSSKKPTPGGEMTHTYAHYPHQPYLSAFENWKATARTEPEAVCRAWSELVALTVVREVHRYGAGPGASPFLQCYARSMAWEDFDMALRGGATGLLRRAVEVLWFRVRTRAHREVLGEELRVAADLARAAAARSGWEPRYSIKDLERPILISPQKLELADMATVYDSEGAHLRRMEAQRQVPDLDAFRAALFGSVPIPRS